VLRALPIAVAFFCACASSAKHTVGAAAINSTVALGAAAAQRAGGGCFAVCANGTICNPRTGLCDAQPSAQVYCEEAPGGGFRCVPLEIGKEERSRGASWKPIGVSPATGSVPPPPAEASPRGP
jgi:hypothetical protein